MKEASRQLDYLDREAQALERQRAAALLRYQAAVRAYLKEVDE
jgi:hypothetical protein